jgi:hypothetical protein
MAATFLEPEALVILHAEGFAAGLVARPLINARLIRGARHVMWFHHGPGWEWAESVLARALVKRDFYEPNWPELRAGEPEILIAAHNLEIRLRQGQRPS